jgi:hypothetical protein
MEFFGMDKSCLLTVLKKLPKTVITKENKFTGKFVWREKKSENIAVAVSAMSVGVSSSCSQEAETGTPTLTPSQKKSLYIMTRYTLLLPYL